MDLSCPDCCAKVLPYRLSADTVMFLCSNRKCLFPVALPNVARFITQIQQLRRGLFRVKTEIARCRAGARKTDGPSDMSNFTN